MTLSNNQHNNQSTNTAQGGTTMHKTLRTHSTTNQTTLRHWAKLRHKQELRPITQIKITPKTTTVKIQRSTTPTTTYTKELPTYTKPVLKKVQPLKANHIPVIMQQGLPHKDFMSTLQNKYPKTNFKDTISEVITKYNSLKQTYIMEHPFYRYIPTAYLKSTAYRSSSFYQLFNYNRVAIVIDYPAQINKSDNGFQTIKKPTLDKLTYTLVNSVITQYVNCKHLTLIDYSTLSKVDIHPGDNIDEILTDLTSQILIDKIPYNHVVDVEDLLATDLYEIAQLYDIDIPTQNLITYSTYHSPNGNTYTNMYPRQYPTDVTLKQLQDLINLYTEYGIITPEQTAYLKAQREFEQDIQAQIDIMKNNW